MKKQILNFLKLSGIGISAFLIIAFLSAFNGWTNQYLIFSGFKVSLIWTLKISRLILECWLVGFIIKFLGKTK